MKTIRIGNDISVQWTITRFGEPEIFEGKDVSVKLIDKLGNDQVFDYIIHENVISGTFYGKDQITNGTYRLLLVENAGEDYMVTLDYIDCFCLSNKMKNQTSNGSDTTSSINTEVIDLTSNMDLSEDLSTYAKITYVDGQIADVKNYVDSSFYNKDEVDQIIEDLPAFDSYTKEETDRLIADVSNNIPTKVSELDNDEGYLVQNDVSAFITEEALEPYAKSEDIPTKVSELQNDSSYITKDELDSSLASYAKTEDIPTKVSDLDNDSGYLVQNDVSTFITIEALDPYAKTEDIPTKVSDLDNDSGYLVSNDVSTFITENDASVFLVANDVSAFITMDALDPYAKTEDIPTKVSDLDNDSGYLVANDVSTFVTKNDASVYLTAEDVSTMVDESELAEVAFSGDYDDLENKPTIPEVPENVSAFNNDAGYLVSNDVSTLVDESDLSQVAFSGSYNDLNNTPDLTHFFDDAVYDSSTKKINFKHGDQVVAFIDATDFIKDGMVDNVVIDNGYVVITFNTDAGKEEIKIDITDIFNPANYYDKDAIDLLLQGKQDKILDLGQLRTDASNGAIAYGWGNHAEAGYLKPIDVSNFITEDDASVFLTSNDVSTFVDEDDLSQVAFSGDYNDLENKPTIPTVPTNVSAFVNDASYLTPNDVSTFITEDEASVFLTADDVSTFVKEDDLATVATTGNYDDLENKPTIPEVPTNVSAFVNDASYLTPNDTSIFLTSDDVSTFITEDDASVFLTANDVSTFITEDDASIYLTADDVSTFVKEDDLSTVATTGNYEDLENKPEIPEVPTNVSAFTNDASYLTPNDVSTFLTSDDVSTFITEDDASVFLKADDVSTFITEEDASIFLTSNDVSTFITENDVSTFITEDDASIFLTPVDVSTFITSDDVSTFITIGQAAESFEMKGWRGTQEQYDALTVIEQNRLYIILDSSTN